MKPLNINTAGCDPISSNCVIWQGPDIPCIKLCKGDTISDVVYKMATELCTVLEALDVTTYDLPAACFPNQSCSPADFHDLIQIIINKVCCLAQGNTACQSLGVSGTVDTTSSSSRVAGDTTTAGCPDCEVSIASCFYYKNEFGDQITTMQLVDYTRAIGNRLCGLVSDILTLNSAVSDLDLRVTALETAPAPVVTIPDVIPTCTLLPAIPTPMNLVLTQLEQQYCQLVSVTGNPSSLSNAIAQQCLDLNNSPVLGPSGSTMAAIPGWALNATTVATALNNMWLTVCDLRSAVRTIQLNCCPTGCDGIDFNLTATLSATTLTLYFTGTLPPGFQDCNPLGNRFSISDSLGNSINLNINTVTYFNTPTGYVYDLSGTPINLASDINISSDVCLTNTTTNATCTFCVNYKVVNTNICPSLIVTFNDTATQVTISYTVTVVPANYTLQVWDSSFTSIVYSSSVYNTTGGTKYFTITGLPNSMVFNTRLLISSGGNTTECPYTTFTTPPVLCLAPNNVVASISYPVECPTCGPAIDFIDNITVDGTYVDVTSNYLIDVTGGVPAGFIALQDTETTGTTGSQFLSPTTVALGKTYVGRTDGKIEVWENVGGTFSQVVGSPFTTGAASIMTGMEYDAISGMVFFMHDGSKIGMINPTTYAVTLNLFDTLAFCGQFAINPFNGEKYVTTNGYNVKVISAGTTGLSLLTTITTDGSTAFGASYQPKGLAFNPVNGDVWIPMYQNPYAGTADFVVVSAGPTYTPSVIANPGLGGTYKPSYASSSGLVRFNAYYPGDGTVGTDRMMMTYSDGSGYVKVVSFETAGPYASSVFYTSASPGSGGYTNILYSTVFDKIFLSINANLHMFQPTDSTVDYTNGLTAGTGTLVWPNEDTVNKMIEISTVSAPNNILYWYSADTLNVTECTQNIVNMTLGNSGPYIWDSVGTEWNMMTTSSVLASTPMIGQFTVTSIFESSIVSASLLVSPNYGLTWVAYADTSGNLYADPAAWATGRVYANLPLGTKIKISFTTLSGCSLEGPILI